MASVISFFEVRLKRGRKTFSRHFERSTKEAAEEAGTSYATRYGGHVIGVRKVNADDVIGELRSMRGMKDFVLDKPMTQEELDSISRKQRYSNDVILNEQTLDSIIFSKVESQIENKEKVFKRRIIEKRKENKVEYNNAKAEKI